VGGGGCRAIIYYRQGVTTSTSKPRLIEPYSFAAGKQDLMVRAYQLEKDGDAEESGWRFFMSHKIAVVEPTNIKFKPRRKIVLPEGKITFSAIPDEHWQAPGRQLYRNIVGDAIADGELSPGEVFDIEGVKYKYKLEMEDIRFVHAAIYARCLNAVLVDGFIEAEEVEEIRFLHDAMRRLGWAVGE